MPTLAPRQGARAGSLNTATAPLQDSRSGPPALHLNRNTVSSGALLGAKQRPGGLRQTVAVLGATRLALLIVNRNRKVRQFREARYCVRKGERALRASRP